MRNTRRNEFFSCKHAILAEIGGHVGGMALGYCLAPHGETAKLTGLCQSLRPIDPLEGRPPRSFYLNTLAVYPYEQGHGLGSLLLAAIEAKALRAQRSCILLEVFRDNHQALQFYRRNGFVPWQLPGMAGEGSWRKDDPVIILIKSLRERPVLFG